ncbi:hypothetical protein BGZ63DRAFT_251198 [Mariannaea sp. PMI_226]|nr:hypothetical protein BGZ63DRAFT_251198 [Mariannaea sp. PMI_226]
MTSSSTQSSYMLTERLQTKRVPDVNLLFEVLDEFFGHDQSFRIDMRHNVYNIKTQREFDLGKILEKCDDNTSKGRRR